MATIGDRIRDLRKAHHLTQSEFGKLFGVGKTTISSYETGYSCPNDDIKMAICKYFEVSMDYLHGLQDSTHTSSPAFSGFIFSFEGTGNVSELLKKADIKDVECKTNISSERINKFITGEAYPSPSEWQLFAQYFGCSVDELISENPQPKGDLSDEQKNLISDFSSLSEEDKKKAIEYIKLLKKAAE